MKTKKIIMVELVETNVFSRWHCTVCDGCTNPVSVLAEGKDGKRAIRVCEQCLEAAEIDKRLAATAAAHERHAAPEIIGRQASRPNLRDMEGAHRKGRGVSSVAARGARSQLSGLFARAMRRQRVIGVLRTTTGWQCAKDASSARAGPTPGPQSGSPRPTRKPCA